MGRKISEYTTSVTAIEDDDLIDVSKKTGVSSYESQKATKQVLMTSIKSSIFRCNTETLTTGLNTITFSTPMSSVNYELLIWDVGGIGIGVPATITVNGFQLEALSDGNITYLAILTS